MPELEAIIFDFDGVIADSEFLANKVLAEIVTELGVPTRLEDSYRVYMGKRFEDVLSTISQVTGKPLPENFADHFQARTLGCFRNELQPVTGVAEFLDAFRSMPFAIASSSSLDRLELCLEVLDLKSVFAGNVFSVSMVERGKPAPDVFLLAAERLGVKAEKCIVIEDSASGVQAGITAGMTVMGLTAASHIQPGHHKKLRDAGAHFVAENYDDAIQFVRKRMQAVTD